jgi:hypothetical protein
MKLKVFAVLSFFICFLAAIPPIVSGSDNTEVYVMTLDSAGYSYYMENFGDGTFTAQEFIGGGSVSSGYNYGNGIGDFDNDGDFDYIMGSYSGSIWLYEKLGSGNDFALPVEVGIWDGGMLPMDIAVADYNGDRKIDFILTKYGSSNCELYTAGDGKFEFTRSVITGCAPDSSIGADAADFNNDGNVDFIVATYYGKESFNYFYLNLGYGDGTFETIKFPSYLYTTYGGIAAGDFDGDGIVDFAATDRGIIDIYLGVGDGSFDYGHSITDNGVYVIAPVDNYDFDGDGDQDLVIGRYGSMQGVGVFLGDGEGGFIHSNTYWGGNYSERYAISAPPYVQNEEPVAIVEPAYQEITVGEAVFVNAQGSSDADGEIVSYSWTFEEEGFSEATSFSVTATSFSEGFSAEHVYYQAGLYTITLTVMDNMGATSSVTAQVRVTALGAQIKFNPRTLNLKSRGKWVRATIALPPGYDASRIDVSSVCISEDQNCLIYAHSGSKFRKKKARKLKVKFDRQELLEKLAGPAGKKTLHVQGLVSHKRRSVSFEGSGSIQTIKPHKKDRKNKKSKRSKKSKH